MSDLYTDEEFRQWVRIAWQAHAHWPRRKPPKMDDLRLMLAHALDRMAPKIAARAAEAELRALVAYCFDEHDALVSEGGIDTVEAYIARRRAELNTQTMTEGRGAMTENKRFEKYSEFIKSGVVQFAPGGAVTRPTAFIPAGTEFTTQPSRPEARHGVARIWTEAPGEVSWLCYCGAQNKHLRLPRGSRLVPMCVDDGDGR